MLLSNVFVKTLMIKDTLFTTSRSQTKKYYTLFPARWISVFRLIVVWAHPNYGGFSS